MSTPAPRGSGVATRSPPTRPRRTRTQSSIPIDGRELARDPRRAPRVLGRRGALEGGEQRRGEDVERQRGRHRIAGRTEDRRRPDRAHDDRMAGPHRDAVDGERAEPLDDARPCGRRARRSSRRRRSTRSAVSAAAAHGRGDPLRVVRDDLRAHAPRSPAASACAASMSEFVSRMTPGAASVPTGRISSPVGSTATTRAAADEHVHGPGGRGRGDVDGAQPVTLGQQQLAGADVLPDRAHVLVRRDRPAQLRAAVGRRGGRARA